MYIYVCIYICMHIYTSDQWAPSKVVKDRKRWDAGGGHGRVGALPLRGGDDHLSLSLFLSLFLSLSMYIYIYMYTYIYIYLYIYICMYIFIYTYIYTYVCIYLYICLYIFICISIHKISGRRQKWSKIRSVGMQEEDKEGWVHYRSAGGDTTSVRPRRQPDDWCRPSLIESVYSLYLAVLPKSRTIWSTYPVLLLK